MPALATSRSSPPARFAKRSTARCTWPRSATSAASARCGPPGSRGSRSTTSSKRSLSRATSPSRAPRGASASAQRPADPARGAGDDRPGAGLDPHRRILSRCRSCRRRLSTRRPLLSERDAGARHGRRGGVPPEHVLARGGGAADHRRQHRPRDAALAADRARDDRPARARRLRQPPRRQVARVHRRRPRARAGDRPPPPPDRALPHRRPRASPGTRSTRRPSGSSTRCRRCSRSGCWPRSATPRPARTATRSSRARASRACCWPTSSPAPASTCCGSRTRPRSCCTT